MLWYNLLKLTIILILIMAEGEKMKKDIQPAYYNAEVTCSTCGNAFEVGSTIKTIKVDTCGACHPFYTGKQTYVTAAGRVERFNKRYNISRDGKKTDSNE